MSHQYEYQLTVICTDPECSEEGAEVYAITTETRELATPETIQVMRAEELHEDEEAEFRDFEIQQHRPMPKEEL